jgi:cell division protein FtsI (penicillin-binding protein 3)
MSPPETIKLARAPIVDRNERVLAQTATFDRLDAHPNLIKDEDQQKVVDELTAILDLDDDERAEYLAKLATGRPWTWLHPRLTTKQSIEVSLAKAAGDLPGIALEPLDVRAYPQSGGQPGTTLASHLVGFVAGDGRGAYGVERLYDERLTDAGASLVGVASVSAEPLSLDGVDAPPLRLTIDFKLQRQLEKELNAARLTTGARSVSAVIMDPHTGAILASAAAPGYDANDFAEVASKRPAVLRDPVVSKIFEPGSVMKIFTVTAALDNEVVTPRTTIRDEVAIEFYKAEVQNSDHKGLGPLRVKDVIALSRNVATAKIAERLAPRSTHLAARKLYDLWDKVGLVGKTGVDLAGEEAGLWCDPESCPWAPVDLANRAFGQGVGVTLMQLANGLSTLVNGGFRVQPHVAAEGDLAGVPRRRVLKPKVARQAQEILVHVTGSVPWYAEGSLIPGYMIGGKTGTAQIWDNAKGMWKDNIFNHNFVGFVGGNKPEAVIALRIEEPKAKIRGQGLVEIKIESYELFQNIAKGAIKHLGIRRSKDRNAGLPIIGTAAARALTPARNDQARQQARIRASQAGDVQSANEESSTGKKDGKKNRKNGSDAPGTVSGEGGSASGSRDS